MCPGLPLEADSTHTPTDLLGGFKRRIGCDFEPAVLDVLRRAPSCLDAFLRSLDPLFDSCQVQTAANALRDEADRLTLGAIGFHGHLERLAGGGYSREDSRQVRYLVEAFYSLEPLFAIITALAYEQVRGRLPNPVAVPEECRLARVAFPGPIAFAAEGAAVAAFHIQAARRPVPLFLRGLATWPGYAAVVQSDLSVDRRQACARVSAEVRRRSLELAGPLAAAMMPYLTSRDRADAIDKCLRASCDVIPVVCALRRGFIEDEVRARASPLC